MTLKSTSTKSQKQKSGKPLKAQKNEKAPGSDSVCAEMLKADEKETPRILCQIFQRIWDEEDTPDDWKTGHNYQATKEGRLGEL